MNTKLISIIAVILMATTCVHAQLFLNEVQTSNAATILDEDGGKSDWFEIYNNGASAVDLTGYYATDSAVLTKWQFPTGTVPAHGFLLVWASSKDKVNGVNIHTNFSLSAGGEAVTLTAPDGTTVVDQIPATVIPADTTYGRTTDGGAFGFLATPTPGVSNVPPPVNYSASLSVNEMMSSNVATILDEDGAPSDWIELYNNASSPINLSGFYLTDAAANPTQWKFPDVTIGAKKFLLIWASSKDKINGSNIHTNFSIKAGGEPIILTAPDGTTQVSSFPSTALGADQSIGRTPDGSGSVGILAAPSPNATNIVTVLPLALSFSKAAGLYNGSFSLALSSTHPGATIRYTLDGSIPTVSSPIYTGPILVTNNSGKPNNLSMVNKTSPLWSAPTGEVEKATVVRAIAIDGAETTPVKTATYLVDSSFTLPVMSITTDYNNLFDYNTGIYIMGKTWDDAEAAGWSNGLQFHPANYRNDNDSVWERPVHVEMFETNGTRVIDQDLGLQISGEGSRVRQQKSMRLYARSDYGSSSINYKIFPTRALTSYKRLTLRNGDGNELTTFLRDAMVHKMVLNTSLTVEDYRPVILFMDGEYWGLYPLRENGNQHYLESYYGIDKDNVIILENHAEVKEGLPGDQKPYEDLVDYIASHDLTNAANYNYVTTKIDVDNFARYYSTQTFSGNTDWPDRNVVFWHYNVNTTGGAVAPDDGRWRWILHDVDDAFNFDIGTDAKTDMFKRMDNMTWASAVWRGVSKNEQFRDQFLTITDEELNTNYASSSTVPLWNKLVAEIAPEVPQDLARWNTFVGGVPKWQSNVANVSSYLSARPAFYRQHVIEYFGLGGSAQLTVNGDDARGTVNVDNINVSTTYAGTYFLDTPVTLKAIPKPGKVFLGWTGAASGNNPTLKIVLSGNTAIGAQFADAAGAAPSGNSVWITRKYPATNVNVNEHASVPLLVELSDASGAAVTWVVDGVPAGNGLTFNYANAAVGNHSVDATVDKGSVHLSTHWNIVAKQVVPQVCYSHLVNIPANCSGGAITSDTSVGCRVIACGVPGKSLTVQACEKPNGFEMYVQQRQGSGVSICLGTACISNGGFAQATYPLCIATGTASHDISFASTSPAATSVTLSSGAQNFSYVLDNPASLPITTKWKLNGADVSTQPSYIFNAAIGTYTLLLNVSSNETSIGRNWTIVVSAPSNGSGNSSGNGSSNSSNSTCFNSLNAIPATCVGGNITTDSLGGCRVIVCSNASSSLQIQACNKGSFFEINRQTQVGNSIKNICIGNTCIGNNGYVKSANYPICIGGAPNGTNTTNSTGNATNTTNTTNSTTNFSLTVLSTPSGTLTINGSSFGVTPKTVSLVPGSYAIVVSAANHTSNSTTITLSANTTLSLTLQPIPSETNSTNSTNSTTNVTVTLGIGPWYPKGKEYIFLCNSTGFTPTAYDFYFGDGHQNLGRTTKDVFYTYAASGPYTVTCRARNSTFSQNSTLAISVA